MRPPTAPARVSPPVTCGEASPSEAAEHAAAYAVIVVARDGRCLYSPNLPGFIDAYPWELCWDAEGLERLRAAFMSVAQVDASMQRMVRRIAEAANGMGEAQRTLRDLDLDAQVLSRMAPDQQFLILADAMKKVANQGDRIRFTQKIFDTEGVSLVNTLALGRDGVQGLTAEAKRLGIAPTTAMVKQAEAYKDAVDLATKAQQGLLDDVQRTITPISKAWQDLWTGMTKAARFFMRLQFGGGLGMEFRGGGGVGAGELTESERYASMTRVARDLQKAATEAQSFARPELAARTAGSVDTFAAARRNLRGAGGRGPVERMADYLKSIDEKTPERQSPPQEIPTYLFAGGV